MLGVAAFERAPRTQTGSGTQAMHEAPDDAALPSVPTCSSLLPSPGNVRTYVVHGRWALHDCSIASPSSAPTPAQSPRRLKSCPTSSSAPTPAAMARGSDFQIASWFQGTLHTAASCTVQDAPLPVQPPAVAPPPCCSPPGWRRSWAASWARTAFVCTREAQW